MMVLSKPGGGFVVDVQTDSQKLRRNEAVYAATIARVKPYEEHEMTRRSEFINRVESESASIIFGLNLKDKP